MSRELDLLALEAALTFTIRAMDTYPGHYQEQAICRFNLALIHVRELKRVGAPPELAAVEGVFYPDDPLEHSLRGTFLPLQTMLLIEEEEDL